MGAISMAILEAMDMHDDTVYRNRIPVDMVVDSFPVYQQFHRVKTFSSRMRTPGNTIEAMKEWCGKNTKHSWSSFIGEFFFEDSQDAMWFTMRWV